MKNETDLSGGGKFKGVNYEIHVGGFREYGIHVRKKTLGETMSDMQALLEAVGLHVKLWWTSRALYTA